MSDSQHGEAAKPRLRWTRQLHERFVLAVAQLGGTEKTTPRSVLRVMGVPGLTLHHIKSHLQKYRLAATRDTAAALSGNEASPECDDDDACQEAFCRCTSRNTLQMQMEAQKTRQEQIEVQRHLQLRIEAQGRYLQSVLLKAQEVLIEHSVILSGAEAAEAELSEPVSAVESECLASPSSQPCRGDRASESCVTSSDETDIKSGDVGSFRALKRAYTSMHGRGECAVEQPVHGEAEAEVGSSEIDLNW